MSALVCSVRIKLGRPGGDESTVFGRGTAELLRGVERSGSLNQAAKDMGMAYSKAWTAIKKTEEHLGFALLERRGQRGSVITGEAKRVLEAYDRAGRAAELAVENVLSELDI